MPRTVSYEILDAPDGRFSVVARLEPDRVYRCDGLATRDEAEEWVEGLRILMAACGAPVTCGADTKPEPASAARHGRLFPGTIAK